MKKNMYCMEAGKIFKKSGSSPEDSYNKNEILVISFGTSFEGSRREDIGGIERAVKKAFPMWTVKRAFTSQIIIDHIKNEDKEKIDNIKEAFERALANGVERMLVLPTHFMAGHEYDKIIKASVGYTDKFSALKIAKPLLGFHKDVDDEFNEDKKAVLKIIVEDTVSSLGISDFYEAKKEGYAFVFVGHGTCHDAKVTYSQLQHAGSELGFDNIFIGTVEGDPEGTACESILGIVSDRGFKKVVLRPLMLVSGDHANNDIAGDEEDSWLNKFLFSKKFESVDVMVSGLGRISEIEEIYIRHVKELLN